MTMPDFAELKHLNEWVQWQSKMEFDHGDRDWLQYEFVTPAGAERHKPLTDVYSKNECGTAYCVAGKAVVRAGHVLSEGSLSRVPLIDGRVQSFDYLAAEILGIDYDTASRLFEGDNTADDIDEIIREIFTEHGVNYDQQAPAL